MECRYCQKAFNKGEHLRRHERSHTGLKPYVCKSCNRAFSRQDSLIRHEKLHIREGTGGIKTGLFSPEEELSVRDAATRDARAEVAISTSGIRSPAYNSPPLSNGSLNEDHAVPTVHGCGPSEQQHKGPQDTDPSIPPNAFPMPELDFELMFPDSADLYQTLMSQDTSLQWQMPLGTLPFPCEGPSHSMDNGAASYGTPTSLDDRVSSVGAIPTGGNTQALQDVRRMVTTTSSSVTTAIDGTAINSVFLDEALSMFWVKFIPTFPVLHRATFVFRDCTHPLLLNAIAIGSLYLGPRESIAKGEALWRLAHTAVSTSWQTLVTHRGPYDACDGIQVVITTLLSQVYGVLSKNRSIRTTSQATRGLSFLWARRCGMFDSSPPIQIPPNHASEGEKDHQWRLWVGREIQQRALLAHYMLDGLIAHMSDEPTSVRHASNQLGLPANETAFEASTADDWIQALQFEPRHPQQTSFRSILRVLFSPQNPLPAMDLSAFSLRVVLEGIQSILADCGSDTDDIVGVPSRSDVRAALSRIHTSITQSSAMTTADRLETLLRWHAICLDATVDTASLCRDLCARWSIEQHLWTTSTNSHAAAKYSGAPWAATDDARRALLHAVAIQDIVETLPRGRAHVIHMPASLFAAATVYAAFALTDVPTVKLVGDVDWRAVLDEAGTDEFGVWDTQRYVKNDGAYFGPTRNMVYELNSMHKLMACLKTQWGVAHDMEHVVERWVTLCH